MSKSVDIRLKRIYDPPETRDGIRILSTRYWPRGVPKTAKDEYSIKTSPSRELLKEFKHAGLTWEQYVPRYLDEMRGEEARSAIEHLADLARARTITLMCICEDENRCHRSLLRDLILNSADE